MSVLTWVIDGPLYIPIAVLVLLGARAAWRAVRRCVIGDLAVNLACDRCGADGNADFRCTCASYCGPGCLQGQSEHDARVLRAQTRRDIELLRNEDELNAAIARLIADIDVTDLAAVPRCERCDLETEDALGLPCSCGADCGADHCLSFTRETRGAAGDR